MHCAAGVAVPGYIPLMSLVLGLAVLIALVAARMPSTQNSET